MILVADDQPDIGEALRLLLKRNYRVDLAHSPAILLSKVRATPFDAVLMDLNFARDTTSGQEGLALLPELQSLDPTLPIVVMTAWGSVAGAVEAMRLGARDNVQKPWDNARLRATVKTQVKLSRSLRSRGRLEAESERHRLQHLPLFIADSPAMRLVRDRLESFASSDANVLITGEHGTGKEVIARWLHAKSRRCHRAFVPVDAGALVDGVFESELFGHVKGAFTDAQSDRMGCFEVADQGTLFLDEIGNMPLTQQSKVLRVLQSGELKRVGASRSIQVDVRVVSASNADLGGPGFRQDLRYRLNTLELRLPPLRERQEDIAPLALHSSEDLALGSHESTPLESMTLAALEDCAIANARRKAGGQVEKAAQHLGLSRSALYRRLQRIDQLGDGEKQIPWARIGVSKGVWLGG